MRVIDCVMDVHAPSSLSDRIVDMVGVKPDDYELGEWANNFDEAGWDLSFRVPVERVGRLVELIARLGVDVEVRPVDEDRRL